MRLLPESRGWRIGVAVILAGLVWMAVWFFNSDRALRLRDKELVEWARSGSPSDFEKDFAAPDYHDQWGYSPADVVLTTRGIRMTYPRITITAEESATKRDGDTAVITRRITVTDAGERIEADFHFTWHKESIWPWSWKLREVTAPGVP